MASEDRLEICISLGPGKRAPQQLRPSLGGPKVCLFSATNWRLSGARHRRAGILAPARQRDTRMGSHQQVARRGRGEPKGPQFGLLPAQVGGASRAALFFAPPPPPTPNYLHTFGARLSTRPAPASNSSSCERRRPPLRAVLLELAAGRDECEKRLPMIVSRVLANLVGRTDGRASGAQKAKRTESERAREREREKLKEERQKEPLFYYHCSSQA